MKPKILHIKNMVCDRCIKVVREELEKLGYETDNVILGEARISSEKKQFDLKEIKISLIDLIHYKSANELEKISLSKFLSDKFHLSYQHISSLFSSKEGITIEKYFINQKIEKAKELLVYNELTLSEISYKLGYSSVQHLSNQFKKITGFTPSDFKKLRVK